MYQFLIGVYLYHLINSVGLLMHLYQKIELFLK